MIRLTFILATFMGLLTPPLYADPANPLSVHTVTVFKPDGTSHCESDAGVSTDSMARELTDAGIEVLSSRKGHNGREGIAVCGAPTGQINLYEITSSDLSAALALGFKQLPGN